MKHNRIAVINYGMGNIGSVVNSLVYLGAEPFVVSQKTDFKSADAIILPGVGAFPSAMENIHRLGIQECLEEGVLEQKIPFLGICLGVQLLAKSSLEQGKTEGLAWIDGDVVPIEAEHVPSVPHVGWNNLTLKKEDLFLTRIGRDSHFFFDHSYRFECYDQNTVMASCDYGVDIVSILRKQNIFATQFHPEKSQRSGLKLLRNFLNFVDENRRSGGQDA